MSEPVIRVECLGKQFRIGERRAAYDTLRDTLTRAASAPLRRFFGTVDGRPRSGPPTIWALRDVSFEVAHGEVLGIIGRNGAGKTTLLKILSRITPPTAGTAELRGRVGSLLEVGAGFHPELTGRENIVLNGAILGLKRREILRKFDEIVAFAEVEPFLDTPVKWYSSGMYVRLAFAVAAHLEPEILLVDEVLAVGDAAFQKKCLGKMGDVASEGRTVLFVSHNMTAVKALCPRAILLRDGRLAEDGHAPHVVNAYLDWGRDGRAEMIWDNWMLAPGNELFRLHAVQVCDATGRVTGDIRSEEPFDIAIEYWNLCPGLRLGETVVLYNDEGVCVFGSLSNSDCRWNARPRPTGLFRSTCRVPPNLLPDGHFSVSVLLWADGYRSIYRENQVVEFTVHEIGGARGDYFGRMEGVVRPILRWETELVRALDEVPERP